MTHAPENTLEAAVETHISDILNPDDIWYQVTLPETDREADFIFVHKVPDREQPDIIHTVEVENDWESILEAVGQAHLYAGHFDRAIPCVAIPKGHIEQPEYDYLRGQTPHIRYFEVDA